MDNILLSVVVPAYNASACIKKCIDSIVNQEYKNLDIIIINDGSTDDTGAKIVDFAKMDKRIRTIHQDNRGLMASRKIGVMNALGNYVAFVDSDDWIEKDMYSSILDYDPDKAVDLMTSNLLYDKEGIGTYHKEITIFDEGYYDFQSICEKIYPKMIWNFETAYRGLDSSVCNKVFSKRLLMKVFDKITEDVILGEDALITYLSMLNLSSVLITKYSGYHYVTHDSSMCSNANMKSFQGISFFQERLLDEIKEKNLSVSLNKQVNKYTELLVKIASKNIFGIDIGMVDYLFPYELISNGSNVVIYGGGNVGKSYWKQIRKSKYFNLVYWVDINYETLAETENSIENPSTIYTKEFDYIVIAIMDDSIASEVSAYIKNIFKVPKDKIVWRKPITI